MDDWDSLEDLAFKCYEICMNNNWGRDWQEGGVYLHLEASEFIEALRGKNGTPLDEAADVLFVFLTMLTHYGLYPSSVIWALEEKIKRNMRKDNV